MSSLTILLPTANRTKKLKRNLLHYKEFLKKDINLYILDGSYKDMKKEINIELPRNFIFKKYDPSLGAFERIKKFIKEDGIETKYLCLANDEDIIISNYLEESLKFLEKNEDYSGYYGSVVTFLKPFLNIPRVCFYKSGPPKPININSENYLERLITYISLNINILPFTFWSIRRTKDFLKLYNEKRFSLDLYSLSEELLDQINIPLCGKMYFGNDIMIIRDETKKNHEDVKNKLHPVEIIPRKDIDTILNFIKYNYSFDIKNLEIFLNAFYKTKVFLLDELSGHKFIHSKSLLGRKFSFLISIYMKSNQVLMEIGQYFILKFRISNDEIYKAFKKISRAIPLNS